MTREHREWIADAHKRLMAIRITIRQVCEIENQWPIWIDNDEVRIPGDDVEMPMPPPANDQSFINIFR